MPLDPDYWMAQTIRAIQQQLRDLMTMPALANASADGTNGWMKISANAVSGQPAIEFHYTGGGGDLLAQIYQTTGGAVQITGGLQVSGTKNFVMNHPTEVGWLLRHASTESPVNGVEYWGEAVLDSSGNATVTLPAYFEKLTKPGNRIVQLTAQKAPASLAYQPIVNGAFSVVGPSGTPFAWLVKAERASQPGDWPIDFNAEEPGNVVPPPVADVQPVTTSSSMTDAPSASSPASSTTTTTSSPPPSSTTTTSSPSSTTTPSSTSTAPATFA